MVLSKELDHCKVKSQDLEYNCSRLKSCLDQKVATVRQQSTGIDTVDY